jgi:flavin-dependent thymidylate synthase
MGSEECPTCGSHAPNMHPAIQSEGEVTHFCPDPWHNAGKMVQRWSDAHQYRSEPMPQGASGPRVYLLNATPDPLGSLAALVATYSGRVVRSLSEVTDEERRAAYADMGATALNSALECMQFHFLFEGVDRAFTHQHVRGRHAFYAQESLRFAVKEDWAQEIPLPPHLAGQPEDAPQVRIWRQTLNRIEDAYGALVSDGMPAEEARGLLPHAVTTRIHWVVTWRELLHVAGLRTCTQAQFVWRQVLAEVAKALRDYRTRQQVPGYAGPPVMDAWQFDFLADQIRPVCYQTGRCQFRADFDRSCTIRQRVELNARAGRPSELWDIEGRICNGGMVRWDDDPASMSPVAAKHDDHLDEVILAIKPWEWAADPAAARKAAGNG